VADKSRARAPQRPIVSPEPGDDHIVKMPGRERWRFYLDRHAQVLDAPSVGSRTAERLRNAGIHTVDDLLRADPQALALQLRDRRVTAETVRQWQQQTALACRVPELRGHDAQILVAVGITDPEQLAQADAASLWQKVASFIQTKEAKRIIRSGKQPDAEEVRQWILWAADSRALNAA